MDALFPVIPNDCVNLRFDLCFFRGLARGERPDNKAWDSEGKVIGAGIRKFKAKSAEEAEMVAAEVAIGLAIAFGWNEVYIEGDCSEIIPSLILEVVPIPYSALLVAFFLLLLVLKENHLDQSTVAIKERFGKFQEVMEPGCHCLPWFLGSQVAGHLSLRLQQLDVKCETKTKVPILPQHPYHALHFLWDENVSILTDIVTLLDAKDNVFVNVVASIQYRALANNASDAFYKLSNTRSQIQAYVFDVIRGTVPKLNLDDTFEQKNDIARAVEEELEKAMSAYGYEIVQTLIVDIEPDEHVKRAMNEINAAARMRLAANEKAEAEKIVQIKRAEGEAEAKYLSGLGIARQRQAIVDGLRDSVLGFSDNVPGTSAKDVMDMVLVTQYFDTLKEIGASSKSSAVFIPHGPGAVREVATQIRDGLLQASSTQ
ncbi:hypothetical protein IFM89_004946 [Coptis chinensis]|uniref:Band 7 domain-containing protein n=1 Tax=Coptis chinensis TaxID=261450 RepID=A0A835LQZ4_9MAGN|nr:hypothetical protein IFM89_004946 [Coptis chinensis]